MIAIRHDDSNHARTRKAYAKLTGQDVTRFTDRAPGKSRLAAKFNATHVPYTGVAEALPDTIAGPVPIPVEAGLPDVEYEGWCGIAPGKVPRPIIAKISKEMKWVVLKRLIRSRRQVWRNWVFMNRPSRACER